MLGSEPGIVVVAELSPRDLEETAQTIVWDLGPAGRADLDALARAVSAGGIVLALVEDDDVVAGALAAGARGILFRDADGSRLAAALQALARGLVVIDEGLAAG